jgi:hypothetical protein
MNKRKEQIIEAQLNPDVKVWSNKEFKALQEEEIARKHLKSGY